VLKQLHDELDLAVLDAYGWDDLAPLMNAVNGSTPGGGATAASRDEAKRALDDALLERFVALNFERAAEEVKGQVRWLRPEFQIQVATRPASIQGTLDVVEGGDTSVATGTVSRLPWPKELPERIRLVAQVLAAAKVPLSEEQIAERFGGKGSGKKGLAPLIETPVALGRARRVKGGVLGVD